jgi:hypothetical protein
VDISLFFTLALSFRQARDFAEAKGNLRLLDGDALLDLLSEHYEELDARYRAEIPLKRVYIPEPAEEAGEERAVDSFARPSAGLPVLQQAARALCASAKRVAAGCSMPVEYSCAGVSTVLRPALSPCFTGRISSR